MSKEVKRFTGWSMPFFPRFDLRTLVNRLRMDDKACLARQQGSCAGRENCPDCAWSEGPPADRR